MRKQLLAVSALLAATVFTGVTTGTATAAPAPPAPVAVQANPSAAGTLAMVPKEYQGKGTLITDDTVITGPVTAVCCPDLLKYKNATVLKVIDGATPSGYRVDDYVLNLAAHTNFGGTYTYSPIQYPDPCPTTQNCALITTQNAGATGKRVSWSYYTVNVNNEPRIVSASATINVYYPTDQHYRDVAVCAAVSHVAGLNYTRAPAVSCLDTEPWTGTTSTYWHGLDWNYVNGLWKTSGLPNW